MEGYLIYLTSVSQCSLHPKTNELERTRRYEYASATTKSLEELIRIPVTAYGCDALSSL